MIIVGVYSAVSRYFDKKQDDVDMASNHATHILSLPKVAFAPRLRTNFGEMHASNIEQRGRFLTTPRPPQQWHLRSQRSLAKV